MLFSSILLLLLSSSLTSVSAIGSHRARNGAYPLDRSRIRVVHRRHHARLNARGGCDDDSPANSTSNLAGPKGGPGPANLGNFQGGANSTTTSASNISTSTSPSTAALAANTLAASTYTNTTVSPVCSTEGAWQCVGMNLQVCDHNAWVTLATCSGPDIVCSSTGAVGCVWANTNGNYANITTGGSDDGEDGNTEPCDDGDDTEVIYASGSQVLTTTLVAQGLIATASPTSNVTTKSAALPVTATATLTTATLNNGSATTATLINNSTGIPSATLPPSNLSSILSATTTATVPVVTSGTSVVSAAFTNPHWVVYADNWLSGMPSVQSLYAYNRFVLAFWMSNNGPVDNALNWAQMDPTYRAGILQQYHANGIALMVSAFGSTDAPTSWGYDPIKTAQALAAFVIQYGFDGVDIDYEDMNAMNNNLAEAWIISFQQELRSLLPSPYLISHAPVAPWFTSANDYASGAYVNIHQTVGWSIDWYNVQYYNQGVGVYDDVNSIVFQSPSPWPSTSIFELNSYAQVPLNKIVLGKPMDSSQADNGYVTTDIINGCIQQGAAQAGWNGGVMLWEWTDQAPGIMAAIRSNTGVVAGLN